MTVTEFWDSTYYEVSLVVEAARERTTSLAWQTAAYVGSLFAGKFPKWEDVMSECRPSRKAPEKPKTREAFIAMLNGIVPTDEKKARSARRKAARAKLGQELLARRKARAAARG